MRETAGTTPSAVTPGLSHASSFSMNRQIRTTFIIHNQRQGILYLNIQPNPNKWLLPLIYTLFVSNYAYQVAAPGSSSSIISFCLWDLVSDQQLSPILSIWYHTTTLPTLKTRLRQDSLQLKHRQAFDVTEHFWYSGFFQCLINMTTCKEVQLSLHCKYNKNIVTSVFVVKGPTMSLFSNKCSSTPDRLLVFT